MNIFSPLGDDSFFVENIDQGEIKDFSLKMFTVNMTQKCIDYNIVIPDMYIKMLCIKSLCTLETNYTFRPKAGFKIKYNNLIQFLFNKNEFNKNNIENFQDEGFIVAGQIIKSKRTFEKGMQYATEVTVRINFSEFDSEYIKYIKNGLNKEKENNKNDYINNKRLIYLDFE